MKWWSFYDSKTGEFSDRTYAGNSPEKNTPAGFTRIAGRYDRLSQRVNVETGAVVEHQPPKPNDDVQWNAISKRWELSREAKAEITDDLLARATIAELEIGSARALREGLLEVLPVDSPVRMRLLKADQAIQDERPKLKRT